MNRPSAIVERLTVRSFTIPIDSDFESDGTLTWDSTTIVVVEAASGPCCGIGYSYTDASVAQVIDQRLRPLVEGQAAMDVSAMWETLGEAVRSLGRRGLATMAMSAVDWAVWDLKARSCWNCP